MAVNTPASTVQPPCRILPLQDPPLQELLLWGSPYSPSAGSGKWSIRKPGSRCREVAGVLAESASREG